MKGKIFCTVLYFLVFLVYFPSAAYSEGISFGEIVRKVFGTQKVVFLHGEGEFHEEQIVYIYSGEKLVGTGEICSVYSDEVYTCEVKGDAYRKVEVGDVVANAPPEKFREELRKREEAAAREISVVITRVEGEIESLRELPVSSPEHPGEDDAGAGREGEPIFENEEAGGIVQKSHGNSSDDPLSSLEELALDYIGRGRCSDGERLLDMYLELARGVYLPRNWAESITRINMTANQLIHQGEYGCAETLLTKVAGTLEGEQEREGAAWEIIRVYGRLSYLYGEWGKDGKAVRYRKRSMEMSRKYGVDRTRFVSK